MSKKTLKLLSALFLIITTIVVSCTTEENSSNKLTEKLNEFEKTLNHSSHTSREEYTLETIKSEENDYDQYGLDLYNSMVDIQDYIKILKADPNSDYDDVKQKTYAEIKELKLSPDMAFNETEQLLYDSFTENMAFEDACETAKNYELFVYTNIRDQSTVENFLRIISDIKYASFYGRAQTLSGFEICVTDCMRDTYTSYNLVDWAQFATSMGGSVLWTFGSCSWDCR